MFAPFTRQAGARAGFTRSAELFFVRWVLEFKGAYWLECMCTFLFTCAHRIDYGEQFQERLKNGSKNY